MDNHEEGQRPSSSSYPGVVVQDVNEPITAEVINQAKEILIQLWIPI
ncbi:hypothetical protein U9R62_17365 [Cylindrospermopsis raciborskii DSH]